VTAAHETAHDPARDPATASTGQAGPLVRTPYPGPGARQIIERMRAVEGAGPRTGGDDPPLVVETASGSLLIDPDGNRFVDLAGSFAAATVGHAHPAVVAAVREQAGRVSHVSSASTSEPRIAFEEALVGIAPTGLDRVLLGISGSDANDTALRLARTFTGRHEIIAFSGGYFGRASGVIGVNGKARFREGVGIQADAQFLPYPYRYRWPLGPGDTAGEAALALVRHALEDPASGTGAVAAIVVEPVQGNGGVVIPPDGFLAGLRELCDRHGIVLIFDEIQCGFGRTGRVWAADHWGVVPDLMTVGKGIGGGLALSAVVGREALMRHWAPGTHTSTFMGDAVNLAAGSAAIGVLRDERLAERSATLGGRVLERLGRGLAGEPHVGEIRGLGLFIGIEIVTDPESRTAEVARTARIRRAAFERGVLLGAGGHADNVIKLCPPLTIDEDLLETALDLTVEIIRGTT
jgi:4-aminobutyrate aminotransferase-like enzyme